MRLPPLLLVLAACTPDGGLTVHDNNRPPEVTLLAPAANESFVVGDPVEFTALVEDDATLMADLQLSWRTTNGGALEGTLTAVDDTVTLLVLDLATGDHDVTLTAVDAQGADGQAEVAIVVEDNLPPTVSFADPGQGDRYALGTDVLVVASFDDDWDPTADIGLSWADEAAVSGAPTAPDDAGEAHITLSGLALGPHRVTVTASDTFGSTRTVSVDFVVVDPDGDSDGHDSAEFGGDDCDDTLGSIHPGADEVCDGDDNDCDDATDEEPVDGDAWYFDQDLDGVGDFAVTTVACAAPTPQWKATGGDCDDDDNAKFPGNPEVCDGKDNDCANGVDNGLTFANYYTDGDGDTWGTGTATNACAQPPNTATRGGDCADDDGARFPGNPEVCDGKDNDCANGADDGLTFLDWYYDFDLDGFGDPLVSQNRCDTPAGRWVDVAGDCDDDDEYVNPDEVETCSNGVDDDCANGVDDGCDVDHSGVWKLYIPGTNTVRNVTYGCDGWSFTFDTVVIDAAWPSIEIIAGGSTDIRVNGCEPGFNCDGDGMLGSYDTDTDWSAADSVDPFFGIGYYEYYDWRAESGVSGTKATFIDDDTFRASFAWRFQAAPPPWGSPPPAECVAGFLTVEGRRQ